MNTLTILREARERYAASPSHAPFGEQPEPETVCAVTACGFDTGYGKAVRALADAAGIQADFPRGAVIEWNAEHTTAEVLAAFDRAIATEASS